MTKVRVCRRCGVHWVRLDRSVTHECVDEILPDAGKRAKGWKRNRGK